jgi:hypothetical protein
MRVAGCFTGLCLIVLSVGGCRSPYYADRGALFGGLTGAGVGAAIGEASDNPLAGALIGGAVGTAAGAIVGDGIDADIARNNAEIQARMGRQLSGAATTADVISMSQAGLGDDVIVTHIQTNGVVQRPPAAELIALKNQGVSDRVINALQQAPPPRGAVQPVMYAQPAYGPAPVIVEEHYWGPAYCPPRPYRWHPHHHHHHYPPPGGVTWGVEFSHR